MAEPTPLGRRLREVREGAGISANALSLAAGVARDAVRKVEEGDIENPGTEFLSRVGDVLGASLDWLVHGRGKAPSLKDLHEAAERVRVANVKRTGTEG